MNNIDSINKTILVGRILQKPINQAILKFINDSKAESLSVGEIAILLRKNRVDMSKRLNKMKKIGILQSNRYGKFIFYSINYTRLGTYESLFTEIKKLSNEEN